MRPAIYHASLYPQPSPLSHKQFVCCSMRVFPRTGTPVLVSSAMTWSWVQEGYLPRTTAMLAVTKGVAWEVPDINFVPAASISWPGARIATLELLQHTAGVQWQHSSSTAAAQRSVHGSVVAPQQTVWCCPHILAVCCQTVQDGLYIHSVACL
jgi:hypothetical protein